jgi:lipid-A-disaccharide synthase-like uncharacterized protein
MTLIDRILAIHMLGFGIKDLLNLGTVGSGFFFLSWLLQAYETKKSGHSVVSIRFWMLRLLGLALVLTYTIQIHNLLFILTNSLAILLTFYNISVTIKTSKGERK